MAKTVRRTVRARKGARGVCVAGAPELCVAEAHRRGRPRVCVALPVDARELAHDPAQTVMEFARRDRRSTGASSPVGVLCAVRRWTQGALGPVVFDLAPTMTGGL